MKFWIIAFAATLATLFVPYVLSGGPTITQVEKVEVNGIENFSQLEEPSGFAGRKIGFGGATQAVAMASLKRKGFVTVINLRLADEEDVDLQGNGGAAREAGLNYIHLPFDTSAPATDVVNKFLAIVGNEENQPVYVHCGSATRAAALWMIGRVLVDNWEVSAASAEVERIARKPGDAIAFASGYIESHEK